MGFLSKLFGRRDTSKVNGQPSVEPVEYKGHFIYPEAKAEGGQYRIAGRMIKEIDGQQREHVFIRSDLLQSQQDANDLMLRKAKLCIDQMGDNIYS